MSIIFLARVCLCDEKYSSTGDRQWTMRLVLVLMLVLVLVVVKAT